MIAVSMVFVLSVIAWTRRKVASGPGGKGPQSVPSLTCYFQFPGVI